MIERKWKRQSFYGNLLYSIRSAQQKAKIFKLVDQQSEADKIQQGMDLAKAAGLELNKNSAKKEYVKRVAFQQLKLCKSVSILEPFAIPTWEQMYDDDQTFLSFLLSNQNQAIATENPLLFDFKAPLELEIMLLRDSQM